MNATGLLFHQQFDYKRRLAGVRHRVRESFAGEVIPADVRAVVVREGPGAVRQAGEGNIFVRVMDEFPDGLAFDVQEVFFLRRRCAQVIDKPFQFKFITGVVSGCVECTAGSGVGEAQPFFAVRFDDQEPSAWKESPGSKYSSFCD